MEIVKCNASASKEKKPGLFSRWNPWSKESVKKDPPPSEANAETVIAKVNDKLVVMTDMLSAIQKSVDGLNARIYVLQTELDNLKTHALAHYTTARNAVGYEKALNKAKGIN